MKTLLTLIFTCLFFSETFSQAPVLAAPSLGYDIKGKPEFIKVKNGYLGVRQIENSKKFQNQSTIKTTVSVVSYDDKMKESGENMLSNGDLAFSLLKPKIIKGNKIWVICGDPGGKWEKLGNIRATEIDPQTYKPGASKIIVSAEDINESNSYAAFQLKIISSPNSKFYCLYFGGARYDNFILACLNSDLEPIWKGKKEIPKTKCDDITDLSINDNGEIIVSSITKSVVTLSVFNVNGSQVNQKIDFGNAEPGFIDILQSKSGDTYIGGILSKDSKYKNTVFLSKLEKDHSLTNIKEFQFPENILDRLGKDALAKTDDKKGGLTGKRIQPELVEQADGRIKLITETTYEKSADYMGFGGLIITDFYKTENQFSLIPRFMVDFNNLPRINQFIVVPSANNIIIIYADNQENINLDIIDRQKPLNGSAIAALYAATVDNDGVIKREIVATRANKEEKRTTAELIQAFIANNK